MRRTCRRISIKMTVNFTGVLLANYVFSSYDCVRLKYIFLGHGYTKSKCISMINNVCMCSRRKRPLHLPILTDPFFTLLYSSGDLWNRHLSGSHKFNATTTALNIKSSEPISINNFAAHSISKYFIILRFYHDVKALANV